MAHQEYDPEAFAAAHAQVVNMPYDDGSGMYDQAQYGVEQQMETTPVHEAAALGDLDTLYHYLQPEYLQQFDINGPDPYGRTPLVYAILAEHLDCVEMLLQAGAHIDSPDADGRTALHWTAFHGKSKMMKYLLSLGAQVTFRDFEGRTPLHLSTGTNSSKCTKQLLKHVPPELVNEPDNENMTALHWAAFHDHPKHIGQLINAGADVNLIDNEGKTALHWTANNPTTNACIRILESAPELLNAQDAEGRTVLHLAVAENNIDMVDLLTSVEGCAISAQDQMQRTPLHWAAVLGHHEIATMLLERGADHSAADDNGATALHYAAQNEDPACLAAILQFDQVVDSVDNQGRTALMWAAAKGALECVRLMAEQRFDLQAYDETGGTALHAAAYSGQTECVKELIQHGAAVDALDAQNQSPIFRACETGFAEVVITLLQAGASVQRPDVDGRYPLHWAALGGHEYICLQLAEAGANIDAIDAQRRTALHCSAFGGHINAMSVLLNHHADVDAFDSEGITALHWAASSGRLDAVKLLVEYGASPNPMEVDGDKLTPLDYAVIGDGEGHSYDDVVEYLLDHGGLSINTIKEMAATVLQAWWRGHKTRQTVYAMKGGVKPKARIQGRQKKRFSSKSSSSSSLSAIEEDRRRKEARKREREAAEQAVVAQQQAQQQARQSRHQNLLLSANKVGAVASQERLRIETIRRKQRAALAIQRWWRHVQKRRAAQGRRPAPKREIARSPSRSSLTSASKVGGDRWKRQIAALTIQLAWRQYMRRKLLKQAKAKAERRWNSSVLASAQRMRLQTVYGREPVTVMYKPAATSMRRPSKLTRASPAVNSFNFAVSKYNGPLVRQVTDRRPSLKRRSSGSKQPGGGSVTASPTRRQSVSVA